MSYCVQCGVKLSDYHKKCPLCGTEVINPNTYEFAANTDYPDYPVVNEGEASPVRRYMTGIILSIQAFVYSFVVLFIDWITGKGINWSLIPTLSLALLWFSVAYPFFRKKNSFFRLFTYDCIALIVYIMLLNYIISGNFIWARYVAVSVLFLWIIIAGIFLTDKIRKVFPITIYYILSTVIIVFISLSFAEQKIAILKLGLPVIISFVVISLISYFIIKSSSKGAWTMVSVLLVSSTLMCLIIDATLHYSVHSSIGFTWSLIVAVVTIPLTATITAISKSNELYAAISKKLHR
ncbi:MAG: hypothetical protein JXN65_03365 [Clostridia bacterium]|nr:hypothetical protein [Clostridia bacterium]